MTIYAIGDIHGHLDKLHAAHDLVEADRAREGTSGAELVHVGDLVDRGPASADVVSYLMDRARSDPRIVVLKGNHDAMFMGFLANRPSRWTESRYLHPNVGGRETLVSYGLPATGGARAIHDAALAAGPADHRAVLDNLPLSHAAGDCLFVHAGIQPGVPLADQTPADLMWIRDEFLYDTRDHGPLIVHGHTPVPAVEHLGNRLAIDTGAAWEGPVSAVAIEGREAWILTANGRRPVERPF